MSIARRRYGVQLLRNWTLIGGAGILAAGLAIASVASAIEVPNEEAAAPADAAEEGTDGNAESRTTRDGVFTAEQAERGLQAFLDNGCAGCHGQEMEGTPGGPKLGAFAFFFEWSERPMSDVYDWMHDNMPPGGAGSLNEQTYADILAAILKKGELPAGDTELTPEMMADIILLDAE